MHKNLKHLIKVSKELFSLDYIDKLSKKLGFMDVKGNLIPFEDIPIYDF